MAYLFYGNEHYDISPINHDYPGIFSILDFYDALVHVWDKNTCAPRMRESWDESNYTLGQCSTTAFLAQDIFGGKVYGILRPDGNYHCFNVVDGKYFDLTSEQFKEEKLIYNLDYEQFRELHFAKQEKYERYLYLKEKLMKYLKGNIG